MEIKFIIVKTIGNSNHVIRLDRIMAVSPKIGNSDNKSEIKLLDSTVLLYSTETPQEIFNKINL